MASFTDDDFSIAQRSCRVAGESGTCMFVWECLKTEGKHLGMCMDGFMFGSCCVHDDKENQISMKDETSTETTSSTSISTELTTISSTSTLKSTRPTRPSRPSKPSHHVKWPNFHLVPDKNKNKIDKDAEKTTHFVSLKQPQDPRPNLTTTTVKPTRKPTVAWSWEQKTTTSTESHVYFPSSQSTTNYASTMNVGHDMELPEATVKDEKPTRPTRPPKPSSIDLVTYFPKATTSTTTTSTTTTRRSTTTRRTTTTSRTTSTRTTTTKRTTTTRKTTRKPTVRPTLKPLQSITKKPHQPRNGGCGLPQRSSSCPKGRIVNGTQSCYGQFPWQVINFS